MNLKPVWTIKAVERSSASFTLGYPSRLPTSSRHSNSHCMPSVSPQHCCWINYSLYSELSSLTH